MTQQQKSTIHKLIINATKARDRALCHFMAEFGDTNIALVTWFKMNRKEYIGGTRYGAK